tara:strand:+ start:118 stop:1452 length:1335 start_codon:yes stop_codon:yes gene_type:complete
MADFQIGTQMKDGSVYAGPQYGFVKPKQYQQLLAEGKLGRGQQTFNKGLKVLGNRFNNAYQVLPQNLRTKINDNGKGIWKGVQQIAKGAWDVQPQDHKDFAKNALRVANAPSWAVVEGSKKVDPTGRGLSPDVVNSLEMLLPFLGGAKNVATKGGKKLLSKIDDVGQAALKNKKKLALVTEGVPTNGKSVLNGNGGNGFHKPLQITVDPKHRVIDPGFTQKTSNQDWLHDLSKKVKSTNKDKVNRAWATPPSAIDDSPIMYSKQTFKNPLYKQHHLDPKAEDAVFKKLMLEFGDKEDLINMHAVANTKGVGGGDRMSNILYMLDEAHTQGEGALHPWRRSQESILGLTMEPGPKKLEEALRKASGGDPNKLMDLYKQYIQVNFIPSRNQAFKLQSQFAKEIGENIKSRPNLQLVVNKKRSPKDVDIDKLMDSIPEHFYRKDLSL